MKVVLVAMDKAPSNAFRELGQTLQSRKVKVAAFLGNGDKMPADSAAIDIAIKDADFVLSGISSSPDLAKVELAAIASAKAHGKPYGYYSDTWHCWNRPWVNEYMKFANLLLVTNKADAVKAQRAFPGPKVVLTGNPTDEDFGATMTKFNAQFRLGVGFVGLEAVDKVIVVPGTKDRNVNLWTLWSVVSASRSPLMQGFSSRVYFCPHPGDKTPLDEYDEYINSEFGKKPFPFDRKLHIVPGDRMSTGEVICGADIVVGVAATEGRRAAYLRIPVVNVLNKPALDRLEKINQYRGWPPTEPEDGTEVAVHNADELAYAMATLLTPEGFAPLKKRQEEAYPAPPAKGTAANNMADEIMLKVFNDGRGKDDACVFPPSLMAKLAIVPNSPPVCGSCSCAAHPAQNEKHVDVFEIL